MASEKTAPIREHYAALKALGIYVELGCYYCLKRMVPVDEFHDIGSHVVCEGCAEIQREQTVAREKRHAAVRAAAAALPAAPPSLSP